MAQMTKSGLPKSVRRHIRFEKARIRRGFLSEKAKEEAINALYKKQGHNIIKI